MSNWDRQGLDTLKDRLGQLEWLVTPRHPRNVECDHPRGTFYKKKTKNHVPGWIYSKRCNSKKYLLESNISLYDILVRKYIMIVKYPRKIVFLDNIIFKRIFFSKKGRSKLLLITYYTCIIIYLGFCCFFWSKFIKIND